MNIELQMVLGIYAACAAVALGLVVVIRGTDHG